MKRKFISVLSLLLSGVLLLTGCGASGKNGKTDSGSTDSVSLTDMTDRTVTLNLPVSRIVALAPADCEILYAIGAGDMVVGRGTYCDYPAEVIDLPAAASGSDTNIEQLLSMSPDVLIMSSMDQTSEETDQIVEDLKNADIPVVVTDADCLDDVYDAILLLGRITGKDDAASDLISSMLTTFDTVSANADENSGKTVYFEVSPLEYGLWAAGSDTFMNEIADMLGLTNIFADVSGWVEVSEEQVIERNPDYIVTISMMDGQDLSAVDEILGRPGWDHINAVKNEAVLNLTGNELSRPGPRLADGASELYDFVQSHPAD